MDTVHSLFSFIVIDRNTVINDVNGAWGVLGIKVNQTVGSIMKLPEKNGKGLQKLVMKKGTF